ncbi:hypothetical protein E1297_44360 [Roseibium sp. RKSG952]|nr:hypothetical protein [Roseibium sp. RKSG952]
MAGACQHTIEGDSIINEQQRPNDGVSAFVQACVSPNATREDALGIFDELNVSQWISDSPNAGFPRGEFVNQKYLREVGPRGIEGHAYVRLKGYESYCAVRIRGSWLNKAQQPISDALSEGGFKYVENFAQAQEQDFQISKLSGVYQNRGRYFLLIAAQSAQRAGRITDLEFFEFTPNKR